MECVLSLIHRPFEYIQLSHNSKAIILSEFCINFLCPTITSNLKNILIPYLKNKRDFPYDDIIHYLNEYGGINVTNSLFYCIIALEPDDYGKYSTTFLFFTYQ